MENQDSLKTEGEQDTNPEKEVDENEDLKKAKELAENYKVRAEKAEALAKSLKPKVEEKETPKNEMSLKDIRALQDVHDDDVDFVVNWAKANNKTIAEARKDKDVQYVLSGHAEERKTAEAANVGTGRKAVSKTSGDDLLQEAMSGGSIPGDDEGIKKLVQAMHTPKKT